MFLPTSKAEIESLGWERPDVILVTGDTYIDSPHIGVAVIGKYLTKHGFKTAIIAQPSTRESTDIKRLGEPRLFWGVTAGSIDSMVANYTPAKKFRHQDDYTPGGINIRPNRAAIAYTIIIRQYFKDTKPIILGGIEASLRRIAHYDYWDDAVRRSILFDSKADILAYGMAEKTMIELAQALKEGSDWRQIKGICYISNTAPQGKTIGLPSFEEVSTSKQSFRQMAKLFDTNADNTATGFVQKHGDRFLIHNPPQPPLSTEELDEVYDLDFERDAHPYYKTGEIRALETIKQSITTHRGCFGQCNFCSIAVHQGRKVVSRSAQSILDEAARIQQLPGFNGIIYDVGGPTANMYGTTCLKGWVCNNKHCLMPKICPNLRFGHKAQMEILQRLLSAPGIKKVFISSGIRPDLVIADKEYSKLYIEQLVKYHVSGQIKLAPEHCDNEILVLMNKPSVKSLLKFKEMFDGACTASGKRYFMTYYLIAAHPGCTVKHMQRLKDFLTAELKITPEQVQIFTPTPSTISTAMYYCEADMAGNSIFCEKNLGGMQKQKSILKRIERHNPGRPYNKSRGDWQ
ncbi:MAG: YgiQ family radical SAM protein [Dehalococcoidia bacterium]